MPINSIQFPTLSFAQNNPVLSGLGAEQNLYSQGVANAYQAPTLQQQLASATMKNQLTAAQLPFNIANAGPNAAASLATAQAQAPLLGSETALNNQQAKFAGLSAMSRINPMTLLFMRRLYGNMFPNLGGAMGSPSQGSPPPQGTPNQVNSPTISQGPVQPLKHYPIMPGGLTAPQGQRIAQQLAATPPASGNFSDPAVAQVAQALTGAGYQLPTNMGGSQGSLPPSGMGSAWDRTVDNMMTNYQLGANKNPITGAVTNPFNNTTGMADTGEMKTNDQTAIAALQRVQPLIQNMYKNLGQFQTLKGQSELYAGKVGNFLGNSYLSSRFGNLPSQEAYGESSIGLSTESLLKAYGLRPTKYATSMLEASIEPKFGESGASYQQRMINTLNLLSASQKESSSRLATGIPLANGNVTAQFGQPLTNQQVIPSNPMTTPANGTILPNALRNQVAQAPMQAPQFTSQSQFKNWYRNLSPTQRQQFKASHGGG